MRQRRTFRDAGAFYNPLREGLPEAVHKTLFETRDIEDARQRLEDGTVPDTAEATPEPGAKVPVPERFVINAIGIDEDGTRWIEARRRRYQSVDELLGREWDNDFHGFGCRGDRMRGQLRTTGRGNARRYHVWWHAGEDGRLTPGSVELFRYERPAPLYDIEPEDPPRQQIELNEQQLEVISLLTLR